MENHFPYFCLQRLLYVLFVWVAWISLVCIPGGRMGGGKCQNDLLKLKKLPLASSATSFSPQKSRGWGWWGWLLWCWSLEAKGPGSQLGEMLWCGAIPLGFLDDPLVICLAIAWLPSSHFPLIYWTLHLKSRSSNLPTCKRSWYNMEIISPKPVALVDSIIEWQLYDLCFSSIIINQKE